MKIITTQDGTVILSKEQVGVAPDDGYCCDCHRRMGNDFYFLPIDACIHREDGVCNKRTEWRNRAPGEKA